MGPLQVLEGCSKASPEPCLLQAEQPQLSQPVLTGEVLQPLVQVLSFKKSGLAIV